MDGTREQPEEAVAAILDAENHICKHGDISLLIVCDGSADKQSRNGHGGYSLVFKRLAPGSLVDGEVVQQAWAVSPAIDNNLIEAIGVLQSLWQANEEIRAAIEDNRVHLLGTPPAQPGSLNTRDNAIKVVIATDSKTTLEELRTEALLPDIREPRFAQPNEAAPMVQATRPSNPLLSAAQSANRVDFPPPAPRGKTVKELWDEVIGLCVQMSQLLNSLPGGFKVELELRWVPAHLLNSRMKLHAQADFLASNARRTRQHFHKVGRSRMPFVPSVIELIKDFPMVAESVLDRPSEFVVLSQGADVAAGRTSEISDELHQATPRQFEDGLVLVEKAKPKVDKARDKEEKLEIALKQAEADSAKLMAAIKEQEEMKKLFETALEGMRDTAKAHRDAAVEMKDGHRVSLQLVREQHEVALQLVREQEEVALDLGGMEKIRWLSFGVAATAVVWGGMGFLFPETAWHLVLLGRQGC